MDNEEQSQLENQDPTSGDQQLEENEIAFHAEEHEEGEKHKSSHPFIKPMITSEEDNLEGAKRMEEEVRRRMQKNAEEFAEYEAMRKIEREKEEEEIRQLKERRERRKLERMEEEKRLNELRVVEDQKRRAEEEERQRKKREEELRRKEERERKRSEAQERAKQIGKRNFVISKGNAPGSIMYNDQQSEGAVYKSKEQLELERKSALEQRCTPLTIDGFGENQLREKAKELHDQIYRLESEKYDLMQRYQTQNDELMTLGEKCRQIAKGGKDSKAVKVAQTQDPLAQKLTGIPPKLMMYSPYERVKDHRSFGDRRGVFAGALYSEEYVRVEPQQKVILTESGFRLLQPGDSDLQQNGSYEANNNSSASPMEREGQEG